MLVGIADYAANSRQSSQFLGCALGVAPGDDDLAGGVVAMDAADGGARVLVGGGGDGAGV